MIELSKHFGRMGKLERSVVVRNACSAMRGTRRGTRAALYRYSGLALEKSVKKSEFLKFPTNYLPVA